MRPRWILVGLAVGAVVPLPASPPAQPDLLVVERPGGRLVVAAPGGRVRMTYVHSVYREPAAEHFELTGTGLRLVAVSSPSPAVLDYYGIEGRRTRRGGRWVLHPLRPPTYRRLSVLASTRGRRTLVVGRVRLPLYAGPQARRAVLSVAATRRR